MNKLVSISKNTIELFKGIEGLERVEMLEEVDENSVLGYTIWGSQKAFDDFLKSSKMIEILDSDLMRELKLIVTSMDMKTYKIIGAR